MPTVVEEVINSGTEKKIKLKGRWRVFKAFNAITETPVWRDTEQIQKFGSAGKRPTACCVGIGSCNVPEAADLDGVQNNGAGKEYDSAR